MAEPQPQANATARFIGLIFISIGVLWLVLTGLCTAFFLVTLVGESGFNGLGDIMLILPYTVISAILGAGIYFVGRSLRPKA